MNWADGPMCGISIETTGGDDETARIVAVALVFVGPKVPQANESLLIDPGVQIPAEAVSRHSITTKRAHAEGNRPSEALQTIANRIEGSWGVGRPLIGFGIVSTLTVLDREMRRHLGRGLAVTGQVVDPHVIDLAMDHRSGPRSLRETCEYYGVRHDRPHDPVEDALAAARLAWKLARRYPEKVGHKSLPDLQLQQIDWAWQQADHGTEHKGSDGPSVDGTWPIRLNSSVDPRWDQTVLDVIHRKILTDWESKLRADGAGPFPTELHIVNDTRAPHPYFTSIRCLPPKIGTKDAQLIVLMGIMAQAMAADRVVIAWEPGALQWATWRPDTPLPANDRQRMLMILDVVVGTATRLSTHPYTPPSRPPNATPFSWGKATVTNHPAEPLPTVIAAMIEAWREPSRAPRNESRWRYDFRKMEYDITDAIRPLSGQARTSRSRLVRARRTIR